MQSQSSMRSFSNRYSQWRRQFRATSLNCNPCGCHDILSSMSSSSARSLAPLSTSTRPYLSSASPHNNKHSHLHIDSFPAVPRSPCVATNSITWQSPSFLLGDNTSRNLSRRQHSSSASNATTKPSNTSQSRLPKIEDDGLTLSHFIAKSASGIHISQTNSNPNTNAEKNTSQPPNTSFNTIPMAAELGDEFDDTEEVVLEEDLMITDAMSCSTTHDPDDRLRNQMIPSEILDSDNAIEDDPFHTMKFHIKTYGCQMNVNDTDIVRSILLNHHHESSLSTSLSSATTASTTLNNIPLKFIETNDEIQADILLTNTCAIRDNAEQKVWNRLKALRSHDRKFPLEEVEKQQLRLLQEQEQQQQQQKKRKRIIGVLGCMAERLKEDMFQDGTADLVVGPDAYRDLPRLISVLSAPSVVPSFEMEMAHGNNNPTAVRNKNNSKKVTPTLPTERAVNVQLSLDETYASITPIRSNPEDVSAFVSIMRGCNNMCSYCVVPFTRGRERSRDMESVVEETRRLLEEEDIKEVILLGQNVNSYHDACEMRKTRGVTKEQNGNIATASGASTDESEEDESNQAYQTSNPGFSNMFRLRDGDGHRFVDLLDAVSLLSPELRVRFTSPHPKDYPPPLLSLMAERPNICNHLHMPAQSGSSSVLQRMRRGYTREAYLELIDDVKTLIPDVAISSDFISGFCGETEEEHVETLTLMEKVQFDQAFMFAYSMREKTHAHRSMEDDVPLEVKNRRLNEVIKTFRNEVQRRNNEVEVGKFRLVLVEGESKRSTPENRQWSGRTDQNKRVTFPGSSVGGGGMFWTEEEVRPMVSHIISSGMLTNNQLITESLLLDNVVNEGNYLRTKVGLSRGDFAVVQITEARGHTLKGEALWRSSIAGFEELMNMNGWNDIPKPPQAALSEVCGSFLRGHI